MCYDIKSKLESQLTRANRYNDQEWIKKLKKKLEPYGEFEHFHTSGFSHPKLLIYKSTSTHHCELGIGTSLGQRQSAAFAVLEQHHQCQG